MVANVCRVWRGGRDVVGVYILVRVKYYSTRYDDGKYGTRECPERIFGDVRPQDAKDFRSDVNNTCIGVYRRT